MSGTGVAYPADAVSGSPVYAALQARNSFAATMSGATSARPLGGLTGVRPGTPAATITATSTTWTMNPNGFAGYIDLESSVTNSGYFFSFSGTITGTVNAAAGSARVDLIYVQIADSNTGDGSSGAPRVIIDYQAGVAGSGIPTLSAARAFVIAQINVPASGGGSPTVTWVAPYTVAAGGIQPVPTTVYPASPYVGQYVDDASLGLLRWNGTVWRGVSGALSSIIPTSVVVGSGTGSVGASGAVTFSAASSVSINGCFSTAFDNYLVEIECSGSAAAVLDVKLRNAGADDSTNAYVGGFQNNASTTPSYTFATNTFLPFGRANNSATSPTSNEIVFKAPALARATGMLTRATDAVVWAVGGGTLNTTSTYDGFSLLPQSASNLSGTARVYAYNNN